MSTGWTREQMAARCALDIPDGSYVNLGIGIPELVTQFVPEGREFIYHTENGMLGMGPPPTEEDRDLDLMNAAARMVNVVRAVTPDRDPNPAVFQTLIDGLSMLAAGTDPASCALLFQIHILGYTGFRPQTDHCTQCGGNPEPAAVRFSPRSGGLVCLSCGDRNIDRSFHISRGKLMVYLLPIIIWGKINRFGIFQFNG